MRLFTDNMVDLKSKLLDKIKKTNDQEVLKEIVRMLDVNFDEERYVLTTEQDLAVTKAQQEISSGKFLTNEQANQEVNEWFEKK